mgnify:CR=1 FL=1
MNNTCLLHPPVGRVAPFLDYFACVCMKERTEVTRFAPLRVVGLLQFLFVRRSIWRVGRGKKRGGPKNCSALSEGGGEGREGRSGGTCSLYASINTSLMSLYTKMMPPMLCIQAIHSHPNCRSAGTKRISKMAKGGLKPSLSIVIVFPKLQEDSSFETTKMLFVLASAISVRCCRPLRDSQASWRMSFGTLVRDRRSEEKMQSNQLIASTRSLERGKGIVRINR